jgi:hypothetical protein
VDSRKYGWIVSMSRDPLEVPVLWRSREWFYLEDDGTKRLLEGTLEDAHGA